MQTIYLFSGLGADERAFQRLRFPGYKVVFVRWIAPLPAESMQDYACRLLPQITDELPVLLGVSFGGMMAIEVAKQLSVKKLILLSSAKTRREIPFYYRLAGRLRLHRMLPSTLLIKAGSVANWLFSVKSLADKKLLREILLDTDPAFLKWAIDTAARWQNVVVPQNVYHIHGAADRILPHAFADADVRIPDGGHLMLLCNASTVGAAIDAALNTGIEDPKSTIFN